MSQQRCRDCGELFVPYHGKPGYINQCVECATDVQLVVAGDAHDGSGSSFEIMSHPVRRNRFLSNPAHWSNQPMAQ